MLRAEFRVVPYRFRDAAVKDVLTWCDSKTRLAVSYLDVAGGAGDGASSGAMLLLSRPAARELAGWALEPLKELASGQALTALEAAKDRSPPLGDSSPTSVPTCSTTHSAVSAPPGTGRGWTAPGVPDVDLSAGRYARPLDVLLEACDAALSGPGWQPGGRPARHVVAGAVRGRRPVEPAAS